MLTCFQFSMYFQAVMGPGGLPAGLAPEGVVEVGAGLSIPEWEAAGLN